jgi:LysM repeat protein
MLKIKLFFAVLFVFFYTISLALPLDSIGFEKKSGKVFVLHKVEAKETLFAISRKYQLPVNDIKLHNPDISGGIAIGQIIKIPYSGKPMIASVASETNATNSEITHKVEPKETLFSISRKYKISVEQLSKANPEIEKGLKVGQTLQIPTAKTENLKNSNIAATKEPVKEEKLSTKKEAEKTIEPKPEENLEEQEVEASVRKTKSAMTQPPSSSYKKISENGYADLMPNPPDNLKYLAYHKSAPIGTIIQVRNEDNNQKIFVRVIGKISNANDKALLKITPKAFERLGAKEDKVQISISYIP